MTFHQYKDKNVQNTRECYDRLRKDGYTILATDPSPDGKSIHDIEFVDKKIAIVFGNELRGVSDTGLENADQKVWIPMYGFTESLNVSVSAAICINTLLLKLHASGQNFMLSDADKLAIKLDWYRKIVRGADLIEKEFFRTFE